MEYIEGQPLNIVAIQGSARPDNYTAKTLGVIEEAAQCIPGADLQIIDPTDLDLPLPGEPSTADVEYIKAKVEEADGIILATPEYHGSYSSVMKLVIDNLGFPSVLKDKPVTLLGVAAGRIGAIKALEHLRSVASHVGALVLPQVVSVAEVREQFDEGGDILNADLKKFIEGTLMDLLEYVTTHRKSTTDICVLNRN